MLQGTEMGVGLRLRDGGCLGSEGEVDSGLREKGTWGMG